MASAIISTNYFYIRFGELTTPLIPVSKETNLDEIENYMHIRFGSALPSAKHIEFYSRKAKKCLTLNEDVLRHDFNPFLVNTNDDRIIESAMAYVELFVVDDSNTYSTPNLPTST
jgi:hypothetical protein